jgi:hypothetical protein
MVWIILLLVSFAITLVTFCTCGAGGMFLLLALNGFSESQATPFIVLYALLSLGVNAAVSSAASWMIVKNRYPDSGVKFWMVVGVDIIVPVLLLGLIFIIVALKNLVF